MHTFTAFKDGRDWSDKLRLTEATAKREITLPLYPGMSDEQVKLVVQALHASLAQVSQPK